MIHIEKVSLWRGQHYLLKNISWHVEKGENWAILGLNGSGKTTLLNMINGYLFPSTGKVKVLGQQFGEYDLRELRKSIGWVSSALHERIYPTETAMEIVISGKTATIGLYEDPSAEEITVATKLLVQLGCGEYINRPYQTLSQGEKQKILIARALMAKPELLVLDEPCTGLDLFAREALLRFINHLGSEKNAPTLLYVTHRTEEIIPVFDKTLLLKNGSVFQQGNTEHILTENVLNLFFDTPVHIYKNRSRTWINLPAHGQEFIDDH